MAKLCAAWVDGYVLTWTAKNIGDNQAPDTDTAVPLGRSHAVYCEWNTNPVDTGAPNADLHLETSGDGTNYTSTHYCTILSAGAKDIRGSCMVTVPTGTKFIKGRCDINNANVAAGEYLTLTIIPEAPKW